MSATDLVFWQRIALIIAVVFAILLGLGLIGWVAGWIEPPASGREVMCINAADRQHLVEMTKQALDDAYQDQIQHLFEVWMKDLHNQPQRAQAGVANAIAAWRGGHDLVIQYQPPECGR